MNQVVKKDISKFQKKFGIDYQPRFPFCPAVIKTNIMEFYGVEFEEALEIYFEISSYPSAIVRFNDYLFDNIEKYKTFDLRAKKPQ